MEKGKDLLHISITKRVVPGLLINFNVEKIHTHVNSLDWHVEEVLENPSFVVSLLGRPCFLFKNVFLW